MNVDCQNFKYKPSTKARPAESALRRASKQIFVVSRFPVLACRVLGLTVWLTVGLAVGLTVSGCAPAAPVPNYLELHIAAAQGDEAFRQNFGFIEDPSVQAYCRYSTESLIRAAQKVLGAREKPVTPALRILSSPQANAFSAPPDRIYLTSGLFIRAKGHAEFMAVLTHEYSHLLLEHNFIIEPDVKRALNPRAELTFIFSPEQELEADRLAAKLLAELEIDPNSLLMMIQRLGLQSSPSKANAVALRYREQRLAALKESAVKVRSREDPRAEELLRFARQVSIEQQ